MSWIDSVVLWMNSILRLKVLNVLDGNPVRSWWHFQDVHHSWPSVSPPKDKEDCQKKPIASYQDQFRSMTRHKVSLLLVILFSSEVKVPWCDQAATLTPLALSRHSTRSFLSVRMCCQSTNSRRPASTSSPSSTTAPSRQCGTGWSCCWSSTQPSSRPTLPRSSWTIRRSRGGANVDIPATLLTSWT